MDPKSDSAFPSLHEEEMPRADTRTRTGDLLITNRSGDPEAHVSTSQNQSDLAKKASQGPRGAHNRLGASVPHIILDASRPPARFGCLHCGHRAEAFRFPATLLAFTDSINAYIRDHARCEARP
jgi:hypothetical protein